MTAATARRYASAFSRVTPLAVLLLVLMAPVASAGETETFRFDPYPPEVNGERRRTFQLDAAVAATVRESAILVNKTDEPKRYRVYAVDAFEDEDGRIHVANAADPVRGVGTWVGLDPAIITVQPATGEIIDFTLERRSEAGGMAAIVAEEVVEGDEAGLEVVFRIALLVDARGPADGTTGLVVGAPRLHAPPSFLPRQADIVVPVTNETAQPVTARLDVSLESLTGRRFGLAPTEVTLEPGEQQVVTVPWESVPGLPTVVEATAEAQWTGNTVLATSGRMLVLPLWLPTLLVLLTAGLVWRGWANVRSEAMGPAVGQDAEASG